MTDQQMWEAREGIGWHFARAVSMLTSYAWVPGSIPGKCTDSTITYEIRERITVCVWLNRPVP